MASTVLGCSLVFGVRAVSIFEVFALKDVGSPLNAPGILYEFILLFRILDLVDITGLNFYCTGN